MDWNWNSMKRTLMSGWDMMRVLRLFLSLIVMVESVFMHEYFITVLGGFMLFQALTNTGCCAGGACYTEPNRSKEAGQEQVIYEEVKNK